MATSWRQWRQRWFVGGAWFGLMGVRLGLNTLGYRRLCRLLLWLSPKPHWGEFEPRSRVAANLIAQLSTGKWSPIPTCLQRSILLWWLLRWMSIGSDLKTGVRQTAPGCFTMHAWVEQGGVIINDQQRIVRQYTLLWSTLSPDNIVQHNTLKNSR